MVLDLPPPKVFSVIAEPSTVAQRWKKWLSSFEHYITAVSISNEVQKKAILLHVVGTEVQEIFATLNPVDDSYQAVINTLNGYFSPKANIRYERYLFRQCCQVQNESIDNFVTRLRKAAETCEFTVLMPLLIR